jgi:aryl-alcohol dehydrogenase-like predicted oxidoreductase
MFDSDRAVLGTVQLGMPYGLNRTNTMPSQKQALLILEKAWETGINTFDTARAYGLAEERLGMFIKSAGIYNQINVISKISPDLFGSWSRNSLSAHKFGSAISSFTGKKEKQFSRILLENIEQSLNKTGLQRLSACLVHTPEEIFVPHVQEALKLALDKGLIQKAGVSVYEMDDAFKALELDCVSIIQLPFSIFDQRALVPQGKNNQNFFQAAHRKNVHVHVRSAFLQGLILQETPPDNLKYTGPFLNRLNQLLASNPQVCGNPVFQCLNFIKKYALEKSFSNALVFGVSSIDQLMQNMDIIKNSSMDSAAAKILKGAFDDMKKSVIFPSLWKI